MLVFQVSLCVWWCVRVCVQNRQRDGDSSTSCTQAQGMYRIYIAQRSSAPRITTPMGTATMDTVDRQAYLDQNSPTKAAL